MMHTTRNARKKELKQQIKKSSAGAKANTPTTTHLSWMAPKRAPGVTQKLMIKQAVLIDELHKIEVCLTPTHSPHASTSLYSAPLPKLKSSPESAAELLKTKRQHNSDSLWVRRPRPDVASTTTSKKMNKTTTTTSSKTTTTTTTATTEKPRSRSSNPIKRLLVRLEKRSAGLKTVARPE
ncbi:uncharacterized protein ACA1_177510 [Acanthamoeba castellanii str. Neff]|uniref:Uncharacterized protein n=1 Tax=Acanthamoeba castellanii (strain ATCC 30010 / Neff) TaxID=1257118 RepID=L8GU57_ACACF|nr:uncharacterized protein ACA1_177510 [Acanthamoeba castellanii str. Neff]ELR16143.1 hypothetical protein ACA1_177510 [Acanthamoeba castellanii str. Neff]